MLHRPNTEQLHTFEDGEETIVVKTVKLPSWSSYPYSAFEIERPFCVGFGFSTIGAIANLFEKMPRAASEREERDQLADKWDHARAVREAAE